MLGRAQVDDCPVLALPEWEEKRGVVAASALTGLTTGQPAAPPPEGGVVLTSPCKDTDKRVMAELRVYNGVPTGETVHFSVFDADLLCDIVECLSGEYEDVRCSRQLGYARANLGEMSITILGDGRVNMRRMTDIEHVQEVFGALERRLIASVVCNNCGADLLSIVLDSELGEEDSNCAHTLAAAGSTVSIDLDASRQPLTGALLKETLGGRGEELMRALHDLGTTVLEAAKRLAGGEDINLQLAAPIRAAVCRTSEVLADSDGPVALAVGLRVLAGLVCVRRAHDSVMELSKMLVGEAPMPTPTLRAALEQTVSGALDPRRNPGDVHPVALAHLSRIWQAVELLARTGQ